jgi:hypothetical protein
VHETARPIFPPCFNFRLARYTLGTETHLPRETSFSFREVCRMDRFPPVIRMAPVKPTRVCAKGENECSLL